jgi:hypothetical protein
MYEIAASEASAETGACPRLVTAPVPAPVPTDPHAPPVHGAHRSSAAMTTPESGGAATPPRRRGRPAMMTRDQLLGSIRDRAGRPEGLFRIHLTDSDLYARARRMFGSWAAAVAAAGVDYVRAIDRARRRSLETRRRGG